MVDVGDADESLSRARSRSILLSAMNFINGSYVCAKKYVNQTVAPKSGSRISERVMALRRARTPIMATWKTTRPRKTRLQIIGQARPVECC